MTKDHLAFRKERDLGELISDTFLFLRENYKQLWKLLFRIAGPIFLLLVLAISYYSYITRESIGNPLLNENYDANVRQVFFASFFLLCTLLAFFVLLQGVVLHFIKSYMKNEGQVVELEVYSGVKNHFGKILGAMILAGISIFFGLLLILPGIYFWVPFSLVIPNIIFREMGIRQSISQAFNLVRNNWWISFFSLLTMVVLVYIIGLIFQLPLIIYFLIKAFSMVQEGSAADPASLIDWVYVVFSVISSLAQYLLSSIILVATAFIYFNLDEKKYATGSYETISKLGSTDNN